MSGGSGDQTMNVMDFIADPKKDEVAGHQLGWLTSDQA